MLYSTFLTDILNFLAANPREIVVVELKSDGFVVKADKERNGKVVVYTMVPTVAELDEVWEEARKAAEQDSARDIVRAGPGDLGRPIGELINERKRLILIDQIHDPGCWVRNDSYGEAELSSATSALTDSLSWADHVAYNTAEAAPIVAALEKTHVESSHPDENAPTDKPPRGCIYQLQATPTANLVDDLFASLTYSDSSSLLTYVKVCRRSLPGTHAQADALVAAQDGPSHLPLASDEAVQRARQWCVCLTPSGNQR